MLVDGLPADQIPLTDRGLLYGDGLFETFAVLDGRPLLWQRHMARLQAGERAMGFPSSDKALLRREACQVCEGIGRGVLKIVLTRGSGGRGYRPSSQSQPRRIITLHPWPDYPQAWYTQGISLRLCDTRFSRQSRLAGIKHLNRLEQVLARAEWDDASIAEGLMCDEEGYLVSGTQSNLFMLQGDKLITPDLSQSGIAGVVRGLVLEQAENFALKPRIAMLRVNDLKNANALFVTNSVMGLCPVARFEAQRYDFKKIPPELLTLVEKSNNTET
ncbi:MAG: aminodeoxychorismate lyase [Candidatus Thiodiazotropha sp.]|jgi:4-amino-4-deoxychorismate lyase